MARSARRPCRFATHPNLPSSHSVRPPWAADSRSTSPATRRAASIASPQARCPRRSDRRRRRLHVRMVYETATETPRAPVSSRRQLESAIPCDETFPAPADFGEYGVSLSHRRRLLRVIGWATPTICGATNFADAQASLRRRRESASGTCALRRRRSRRARRRPTGDGAIATALDLVPSTDPTVIGGAKARGLVSGWSTSAARRGASTGPFTPAGRCFPMPIPRLFHFAETGDTLFDQSECPSARAMACAARRNAAGPDWVDRHSLAHR